MKLFFVTVALLVGISAVNGQVRIPQGVNTRCYRTSTCTGAVIKEYCTLFDSSTDNINHCCFDGDENNQRANPDQIYFSIDGGACRSCTDGSVINSFGIECYSNCDSDMLDTTNSVDTSPNDFNGCCNSVSTTSGYGSTSINCDAACHDIGPNSAQVGCDPHFYLPLANGDHLCFSIQGQPNFAFNLISDKYIMINAEFVLPAEGESNTIANVSTFIGDLGMLIRNKDTDKHVVIHVSAQDHSVLVDDSLAIVKDKPVFVDVSNGKVAININADSQNTNAKKDESAWVHINSEGFGIKVKFYKKHLDMLFTKTSGLSEEALGLIGQFLTVNVTIDTENMIMKLGDRNPIPVKKDIAWPFLGINAECWYGVDTNNQGAGIIEGFYTDYIVEHLIPKEK